MKKQFLILGFLFSTFAFGAGEARFPKGIIGNLTGNADTATALAANPTDCSANQFANAIAASGNLTCAQPAFTDISGTAAAAQYVTMVGDSGSGGTKGAVPAPGAGDAAASKFLKADGTWSIASGGQGGINYLNPSGGTDSSTFEVNAGNWTSYADAAGVTPVDGTGGAPTLTCARTTSSPLRGVGSLLITKDAANRQGNGCSVAFTIDTADKSKPISISFDYTIGSGTYSGGTSSTDSDLEVYVYDVTNSLLIQPAAYKMDCAVASVNCNFKGSFQASSNSTSYRLITHVATTSASAWTVKTDNMIVGPVVTVNGVPASDSVAWTPTGTWSANTTWTGSKARVGERGYYYARATLSGAPTTGNFTINMPTGEVIDTNKVGATAEELTLDGKCKIRDSSTATYSPGLQNPVYLAGAIQVNIAGTTTYAGTQYLKDQSAVNATTPITFGASDYVECYWNVPIVGWSSNVEMSSDTDTRVVAARAYAQNKSITSGSQIDFSTVDFDTHGAITTGASWKFTSPVPGYYRVSASIYSVTNTFALTVYKNGSADKQIGGTTATAGVPVANGSVIVKLVAGDTIDLRTTANVTTVNDTTGSWVSIERISGPSQIAPSEKIYLQYTGNGGGSVTNAVTNIDFATKVTDSHGTWNGSVFTAPRPGWYNVTGMTFYTSAASRGTYIYVNGTQKYRVSQENGSQSTNSIAGGVYLLAGDQMSFRVDTTSTLSNNSVLHWIAITSQ